MLANQYGITNRFYGGNPAEILPGEFVVREAGTRKQMLDLWWRVYHARKWFPKRVATNLASGYEQL